jgi:hypothetical protein
MGREGSSLYMGRPGSWSLCSLHFRQRPIMMQHRQMLPKMIATSAPRDKPSSVLVAEMAMGSV